MSISTLKRKRSEDLSLSSSTPSSPDHDRITNPQQYQNPWLARDISSDRSTHLNIRTRKRYRDNRPDEQTVYQTTYQKLFKAQTRPQPPLAEPEDTQSIVYPDEVQRTTQKSLHSFWAISQPQPVIEELSVQGSAQAQCEDCDARLEVDSLDIYSMRETRCQNCSRSVCCACSVVMGGERECLQCQGCGWR